MSQEDLKPLDEDVLDLLGHERGAVSAPSAAMARVRARVSASVGKPPAGGPGGGAGGPGAAHLGAYARPLSLVTAFAIGVVAGAAALRAMSPRPVPQIVYVDREVPASGPAPTPPSSHAPASAGGDESPHPPPVAPSASAPSSRDQLAAERALLDVARTALGRGAGEDALAAVAKHEARFPGGVLSEEREAIAIQALLLVKRYSEARARGARFAHRYPGSVLEPAVEAALATIP